MSRYKLAKIDTDFEKELREIIIERQILGKEKPFKHTSLRRLTLAIKRHPYWRAIKEDIILAKLEDDIR